MDVDEKPNKKTYTYNCKLQTYDMLLQNDLQLLSSSFYIYSRPDGFRCTITSKNGITFAKGI